MSRTESHLYELLEALLKEQDRPVTCVEMYDRPEVRKLASSANRVSDYLGGLWRKGKVTRSPAPKSENDSSRWAYSWRQRDESKAEPVQYAEYVNKAVRGQTLLDKPNIVISHTEKTVTIDLPNFTITVNIK